MTVAKECLAPAQGNGSREGKAWYKDCVVLHQGYPVGKEGSDA